jgi:hypothetical protein
MTYNEDFYSAYTQYLDEDIVRNRHAFALRLLGNPETLLDLGCGRALECKRYLTPKKYLGIDVNAIEKGFDDAHLTIIDDYRSSDFFERQSQRLSGFDHFVSLFSIEITAPPHENYKIYDRLFEMGYKKGLVSGFYYATKKHQQIVEEAGGLQSYQTIEPLELFGQESYSETRVIMHVPSKLFGDDVYEVWKLFERR